MMNFWLCRTIKILSVEQKISSTGELFLYIETSLGNKFQCCVKDGMLCSGYAHPHHGIVEREWEMVERYAEKVFHDCGLLPTIVWTDDFHS